MKIFTIKKDRNGRTSEFSGSLQELIVIFSYTLECGQSWEKEKGNVKINREPKSIKSLIKNLNNAADNSASNGYSGVNYYI